MGRIRTWAGCALLVVAGSAMAEGLAGSEWAPVEIAGAPVPEDAGAFVQFGGEGRASGMSGCNRFTGAFAADDDGGFALGPLALTRRACPPPQMELETRFVATLEAARGYLREGAAMTLTDADGATVARFRQTDWD